MSRLLKRIPVYITTHSLRDYAVTAGSKYLCAFSVRAYAHVANIMHDEMSSLRSTSNHPTVEWEWRRAKLTPETPIFWSSLDMDVDTIPLD